MVHYDYAKTFAPTFLVLKLTGTWNEYKSIRAKLLYNIFAVFIVTLMYSLSVASILNLCFNSLPIERFAEDSIVTFELTLSIFKFYYFFINKANVDLLNDLALDPQFQPKNAKQLKMVENMFWWFRIVCVLDRSAAIVTNIVFITIALSKRHNYALPYSAWLPFTLEKSFNYWFAFGHSVAASFLQVFNQVSLDIVIIGYICFLSVQIDLLIENLNDIPGDEGMAEEQKTKFIECVRHHQKIVVFFNKLNDLFSGMAFLQFASSLPSLCVVSFVLAGLEVGSPNFFSCLLLIQFLFGQLLLFCWCGELVYVKSQKISTAAFHSNWINFPNSLKKDLIYFIKRTQEPMQFVTLNMFTISFESFKQIVKSSYSAYTLMQNMYTKETN